MQGELTNRVSKKSLSCYPKLTQDKFTPHLLAIMIPDNLMPVLYFWTYGHTQWSS